MSTGRGAAPRTLTNNRQSRGRSSTATRTSPSAARPRIGIERVKAYHRLEIDLTQSPGGCAAGSWFSRPSRTHAPTMVASVDAIGDEFRG